MGSMSIMEDRGRLTTCLTSGFRVLPNYGNDIRRQYNRILSDIAASKILESIVSQIKGHHEPVGKAGDISQDILESNYALS